MKVYSIISNVDHPLFAGLVLDGPDELEDELLEFRPPETVRFAKNYWTWTKVLRKRNWPTPTASGKVRKFNDFPCINLITPAFSQRAVDLLRDLLEPNGELLPVQHKLGTYYVYNCTTMPNCLDLDRSVYLKHDGGIVGTIDKYAFIPDLVKDLTVFTIRPASRSLFCTQPFVDRVQQHGLQGFVFVKAWSSEGGATDYFLEKKKAHRQAQKIRPKEGPPLPVKGNTVVLRLYTERKKATKSEVEAVNAIMDDIEALLYDPNQSRPDEYFGNIEGHDVVDHEIRVFLSAPDCDRLVERIRPYLQKLHWPGKFQVVKRFGVFVDADAREEYVLV